MSPSTAPTTAASDAGATRRDTAVALRNALKLGGSLIATWAVALLVRLYLPRHLGPELLGVLSFAEGFTAAFFVVLTMGVEMYIQKEIPVRPEHASDFFGGIVAVRLVASAFVFAAMAVVMGLSHRPAAVQTVVLLFGLAHLVMSINASFAALLHASREVSGLAVVNIASKVLWGLGIGLALLLRLGLPGIASALLCAEVLRMAALVVLVRRHLALRVRLDLAAVKVVILASLPFYVNQMAFTIYAKVDVTLLTLLSSDAEVGYYGSAANLAGLALLLSPLVTSVLLPLLSRAARRSPEEMYSILQRAIEVVLLAVLPVSLLMGVGADVWTATLFGPAFTPATTSLRILSPIFVLTYVAMISASCLVLLGRAWTVAGISLAALALSPALHVLLISWGKGALGPGGAGVGAATTLLVTEASVTTALTIAVGRRSFSRATALSIGKAVLSAAIVVAVDLALRPLGPARLAVDMALYVLLLFALGAVRPGEIVELVRFLLRRPVEHG